MRKILEDNIKLIYRLFRVVLFLSLIDIYIKREQLLLISQNAKARVIPSNAIALTAILIAELSVSKSAVLSYIVMLYVVAACNILDELAAISARGVIETCW